MKKAIPLVIATLLLTACQSFKVNATGNITIKDLQGHHFALVSVNNEDVSKKGDSKLSITFDKNMYISGAMCNNFMGMGHLKNNVLTVKPLSSTQMYCVNKKLNQWDKLINDVLTQGAKVSLKGEQLTLANGMNTLVYTLRDLTE
ncbi:META domain-containing protein [Xenorhabdus sp. 42]|uniref:META domain-containing protein n=1 Tax=Xenorhabdus szentirmaii TaxID=290112 RepID=UPI000C053E56|nr:MULTISPECIES: META domain-containing protein [Xenorhabdus]MBD2794241.1 META domain-containing protein [Xenorhabdus sp. CUL]MBD2821621.1 META domain-containing protein [Xenorhabdus sp. 42]MBD2823764.1 META domain-containing protein [Xenorhabdus sp. 5]PHM41024.1 META domain-containing protein [Xenorhabdus szentirmaii]